MVEVYYYISCEKASKATECGIKLSEYADREVEVYSNSTKKCLIAYLNPRDNMELYNNKEYICLKLNVDSQYCFVAQSCLYRLGMKNEYIMKRYLSSIIPVKDYRFGAYRRPECLITTTVIGDDIEIMKKGLDTPVLFENSQELYLNNKMQEFKDKNPYFNNDALYFLCSNLVEQGKLYKHMDKENRLAVFVKTETDEDIILRLPDEL